MIGIGLHIGNRVIVTGGGGGFDADAQAFFDRVTAAGGTLTTTEKNATNQLVLDMKSYGIWSAMKAIYPMVGASAAACSRNLKSDTFNGTFTATGWTFASTGVTPNGTSAYMNTGLIPNTSLLLDSTHGSSYCRTNAVQSGPLFSAEDASNYNNGLYIWPNYSGGTISVRINDDTSTGGTNTSTLGFHLANRTSSSIKKYLRNNVSIFNTTVTSTGLNTSSIYLAASRNNANYTNYEQAFASFGDGLTDTQASNFYTAVQTFNQTLNRQVGAQVVSDADAQAYIDRVYTAGGTLTNTEANAVNQLVIDMKAAGIWTAMKAVYPMVGASAAACAQNLKSSSFTGTFTATGWTFASTGVTPNGTSAYMNTGLNASTELTQNSTHLSYYSRTNVIATQVEMGVAATNYTYLLFNYGGVAYSAINSQEAQRPSTANPTTGFLIGSRTSSTEERYFTNNVSQTRTANSTGKANLNIFLACYNNGGGASLFSTKQCAFSSIGDGLTDTQAADFYTCVNTFQVSLSRNV